MVWIKLNKLATFKYFYVSRGCES